VAELNRFQLHKMTIKAYRTAKRSGEARSFTVQFNPASFAISHKSKLTRRKGMQPLAATPKFVRQEPSALSLELLFDGTGVTELGSVRGLLSGGDVAGAVSDFLAICQTPLSSTHESAYLKISWGAAGPLQSFDCRLGEANVTYTAFDRRGTPTRARVEVVFLQAVEQTKTQRKGNLTSPDLSHSRTVRAGDTLPLLCEEIYGSTVHHAAIARFNDLDGLRSLEPGTTLLFPPVEA
jgi:nucleoid-associated protein YgaU